VAGRSPLSALSSLGSFGSILNVLREVDVRPVRDAAEKPFLIAFVSQDAPIADYLAALMYRGDRQQDTPPYRAAVGMPLDKAATISRASAVVLITRAGRESDEERRVQQALQTAHVPTLVCFLQASDELPPNTANAPPSHAVMLPLVNGTLDEAAAVKGLVQGIRGLKAIDDLALARFLPAFRETISRALIEDVALANAAYSLGTGILEINPITGLPLTVADTIVLTKNQGILAYKIALAMGMPADFMSVMPQLAGVVGGGFLLRQAARGLIGLVPGLGILPKVAIAFAGTFAVGEAVYRWCTTGERMSGDAMRRAHDAALEQGRSIAASLQQRRAEADAQRRRRKAAQSQPAATQATANTLDEAPITLPQPQTDLDADERE
jgi:uncharacterized protein (DUF697 family)